MHRGTIDFNVMCMNIATSCIQQAVFEVHIYAAACCTVHVERAPRAAEAQKQKIGAYAYDTGEPGKVVRSSDHDLKASTSLELGYY